MQVNTGHMKLHFDCQVKLLAETRTTPAMWKRKHNLSRSSCGWGQTVCNVSVTWKFFLALIYNESQCERRIETRVASSQDFFICHWCFNQVILQAHLENAVTEAVQRLSREGSALPNFYNKSNKKCFRKLTWDLVCNYSPENKQKLHLSNNFWS